MACDPVLSSRDLSVLRAQPPERQQQLIGLLERLARRPHGMGDFAEADATGRSIQYLLVGDWVIGFWADHAVQEFRIVTLDEV